MSLDAIHNRRYSPTDDLWKQIAIIVFYQQQQRRRKSNGLSFFICNLVGLLFRHIHSRYV